MDKKETAPAQGAIERLAREIWDRATPMNIVDSNYETRQVEGLELREYCGVALLPVRDVVSGALMSLVRFHKKGEISVLGDLRAIWGDEND